MDIDYDLVEDQYEEVVDAIDASMKIWMAQQAELTKQDVRQLSVMNRARQQFMEFRVAASSRSTWQTSCFASTGLCRRKTL